MADIIWSEAPSSVIHTAEQLIRQYHPWLSEARIAFVMRSEGQKRGSRLILGSTCKVPEKMQPYLEYDFLIWLAENEYTSMSDAQREALIDHELCHCKRNMETLGWQLREHDVQEFAVIVQRHGLWSPDLQLLDEAKEKYRQGNLYADTQITMSTSGGKVATITGKQLKNLAEGGIS